MEYLDPKTIYTFFHVLGAVVGAGGAFLSDAMFFSSMSDKKITATELRFLKIGGRATWLGLALLVISGLFLFSTNPAVYAVSSKFLVKMAIVGVIALNGLIIHNTYIPCMKKCEGRSLKLSKQFQKNAPLMLASGAISVVSWLATLLLGTMRGIPYTFWEGVGIYFVVVVVAVFVAILGRQQFLKV